MDRRTRSSLVSGAIETPLRFETLGTLLKGQAKQYGDRNALISWTGEHLTYENLFQRCSALACALLASDIGPGDHIGIFGENCEIYVEILFASAMISATTVVLNCNYTSSELVGALEAADCKCLFTSSHIGKIDVRPKLDAIKDALKSSQLRELKEVILVRAKGISDNFRTLDEILARSKSIPLCRLSEINQTASPHDICNMQFTSGTTGDPKAAMLSHLSIINNGFLVGECMNLTQQDVICCPPPLFHCFGLVLGMIACITHGSTFVIPAPTFDASATVDSLIQHDCTGLHGVPTMFISILQEHKKRGSPPIRLRTGVAAGASVPRKVIEDMQATFGYQDYVNTYGMTETSPASFNLRYDDPLHEKLTTVGKILPHTFAKVVDAGGNILPRGFRGELCVAGYLLQKGYYKNKVKTAEVMKEEDGVIWMYTGDEAVIQDNGYCSITGRIKDMIIRGGENIFPLEVEERLMLHPAISLASVVGLADKRYGEVVAAFLVGSQTKNLPSVTEIRKFVQQALGRHKAPVHMFWVGQPGSIESIPMTASGKIQKNKLREWGNDRLNKVLAKL